MLKLSKAISAPDFFLFPLLIWNRKRFNYSVLLFFKGRRVDLPRKGYLIWGPYHKQRVFLSYLRGLNLYVEIHWWFPDLIQRISLNGIWTSVINFCTINLELIGLNWLNSSGSLLIDLYMDIFQLHYLQWHD